MKCNWMVETMQKQGKVEGKEMDEHRESCPICKEEARKRLKSVNHSYPIETRWEEPKYPFFFWDMICGGLTKRMQLNCLLMISPEEMISLQSKCME